MAGSGRWRVKCDEYATKFLFGKKEAQELADEWNRDTMCKYAHYIELDGRGRKVKNDV